MKKKKKNFAHLHKLLPARKNPTTYSNGIASDISSSNPVVLFKALSSSIVENTINQLKFLIVRV